MNKSKEKHHAEDEAKKGVKEPDKPANPVNESVQQIPAGQEVKPAAAPNQ